MRPEESGAPPPRPSAVGRHPLGEILPLLGGARVTGAALDDVTVGGATHDSRRVRPGDLYAALPGARLHGAAFAAAAAAAGAVAVLTDPAGEPDALATGLPVLVVADPRAQLGPVARWAYGAPADDLLLIGVTGTNGKTTTAHLVEAGLRAAGHRTGLIGTVETRIADEVTPSVRTTPEATDLQATFAVMRGQRVDAAVMEVSSHALALRRVDGTRFAAAVFTNLSQDHLDFHRSMDDYFAAKARLFTPGFTSAAVVGVDDPAGARLAGSLRAEGELRVATVSADGRGDADWQATEVELARTGSSFRLTGPGPAPGPGVDLRVRTWLAGGFNVTNATLALAALATVGVPIERARAGIAAMSGVPGRMERIDEGQAFLALVDYAHTPVAVARLLAAVRDVIDGRIVVVLGCGGDRDRGKRPLMGAAAVAGADLAVFTSDNPRSEDPGAIIDAMLVGAADRGRVHVEPDRRAAIGFAVAAAGPGDAVVVAGKGHETGQEFADRTDGFDDRAVLRAALASRCPTAGRAG
ncbi:MAG TPA: UDP-N-acetylmuramoyl-L-alanyl-D-glutamate--2,6-diaminopimelate ligase [Mycobacteriales bacterium]|nr:UDP-N-acetylmuramoyl-L-alanyl-D-glutamate--2,6-diaminopimelate ligase [Mycobacteriales bacterium]